MKENNLYFSMLKNVRYAAPWPHNDAQVITDTTIVASSYNLEQIMTFDYNDLNERLRLHFGLTDSDPSQPCTSGVQQYRNHLSTLNSYIAFLGKTIDSRISNELDSSFDNNLRAYLEAMQIAERTRRDRRSQLRTMQKLYNEMRGQSSKPLNKSTSLSEFLRIEIAKTGLAPKTLAKKHGICTSAMQRWMRGAEPNVRGIPSLRRLEQALSLERDTLIKLLQPQTETPDIPTPAFRSRFAAREPHGLRLAESELSPRFKQEWLALLDYKTTDFPTLERFSKGLWRMIPRSMSLHMSELATSGSMVCPAADVVIGSLRTFFGVITKISGLTSPDDYSLSLLAHPRVLDFYLRWLTERSDGIKHNGQKVFCQFAASLVRPESGFLWQQPALFRDRLPADLRPDSDDAWRELCFKSNKMLRLYIKKSNGVSRRPEEPIARLLESDEPLQEIMKAIAAIDRAAAAAAPGSMQEATLRRDALLLAMLLANPLRARTITCLTWFQHGGGTVTGSPEEGWRIQLDANHLKNGDANRSRKYDVRVAQWVKPRLNAYLDEYRSTILNGHSSRYLFVSSRQSDYPWQDMKGRISKLTKKYIPGCPGFGPHAIRHLVATNWLKRHPGDFLTVAELLNDSLATVLTSYAHLKRDDSFSKYEEEIERLINPGS